MGKLTKIKEFLRAAWHRQYRLTVYDGGKAQQFEATERMFAELQADFAIPGWQNNCVWTLYKAGRLFIPEHEIDRCG